MNIFNISQDLLELYDIIEEQEGEVTEDIADKLAITESNLETKLKAYAYKISLLKGEQQVIKDEMDRLKKLSESKTKLEVKLKEIIKDTVIKFGETGKTGNKKLKYDTLNLYTVNKNNVYIDDEDKFYIPEYMKYIAKMDNILYSKLANELNNEDVSFTINKTKLKEDLDSGKEVKGAAIINNPYIVIR